MKYANIKMYKVKFIQYTNCMYDAVSDGKGIQSNYISIPVETSPYIILREDQLDEYRKYGNGYASIEYIGSTIDEDEKDN